LLGLCGFGRAPLASSSLVAWRLVVRSAEFVLNAFGLANTQSTAGWPELPPLPPRLGNSLRSGNPATCARCCCQLFRLAFSYFQLRCGKPPGWDTIGRKPKAQNSIPNSGPTMLLISSPTIPPPLPFARTPPFHHFLNYFSGPDQQTKATRLGSFRFGLF